jgi:hypothetical protein
VGFAPFGGVVVKQVIDFPCRTIRQNSTFRASRVHGYVHGVLAFPQRPIARTPNDLAPMASSFPEVGFEEGLFRRMATQPRVSRSRFLDRETKQGLGRIQHPRKLGSAVTSSRRLSGNWLGYWSQARLSVPIHLGRIPDRRHRCRRTSALPYQGMGPFSSKKPPVGPSSGRVASWMTTLAPSSGPRVSMKRLRALYKALVGCVAAYPLLRNLPQFAPLSYIRPCTWQSRNSPCYRSRTPSSSKCPLICFRQLVSHASIG